MSRAAKAEEACVVAISVEVQGLDLVDPGGDQAVNDIGFKVEVRLATRPCEKEALVVRICVKEAGTECLVDLVRRLRDTGADRGVDMFAPGAELLHRLDGCVGNSRNR